MASRDPNKRFHISTNGHSHKHPLEKWDDWVIETHPELVKAMDKRISKMKLPDDEDMEAVHVSAGRAMLYAAGTMLIGAMTGPVEDGQLNYPKKQVMENLSEIKDRGLEWLEEIFDQYIEEVSGLKEADEDEESEDE